MREYDLIADWSATESQAEIESSDENGISGR